MYEYVCTGHFVRTSQAVDHLCQVCSSYETIMAPSDDDGVPDHVYTKFIEYMPTQSSCSSFTSSPFLPKQRRSSLHLHPSSSYVGDGGMRMGGTLRSNQSTSTTRVMVETRPEVEVRIIRRHVRGADREATESHGSA